MRGMARCLLICAVALSLAAMPGAKARAEDLILAEEPHPPGHLSAWIFTGLGLVSFGVAYSDYEQDEYNITKAKKSYKNYQAATTPDAALTYRDQTTTYIDRAKNYESGGNVGLLIGIAFALTAIATFRSHGDSSTPILLSDRGVGWTYRF